MIRGLTAAVRAAHREIQVGSRIIRDTRTPRLAKILLGLALAYAASPIDLVPDFIPLLGQLDDLIVISLLFAAALAIVPTDVVRYHQNALRDETDGGQQAAAPDGPRRADHRHGWRAPGASPRRP